jgi:mono/diheme cytochrome c family protein
MWRDHQVARLALAISLATSATSLAIVTPAHAADEASIELAAGDGLIETRSACAACHSLDYIVMNSPFLDQAGWEKTVTKMIKVMGAPIAPEQAAIIVQYLASRYGTTLTPPD